MVCWYICAKKAIFRDSCIDNEARGGTAVYGKKVSFSQSQLCSRRQRQGRTERQVTQLRSNTKTAPLSTEQRTHFFSSAGASVMLRW